MHASDYSYAVQEVGVYEIFDLLIQREHTILSTGIILFVAANTKGQITCQNSVRDLCDFKIT